MKALAQHGPCREHRRSFVNVRSLGLSEIDADLANSDASDSCYPPGSGQNGPIVDVIEASDWPTAGFAAMARGA